jgi:hypothetical protein
VTFAAITRLAEGLRIIVTAITTKSNYKHNPEKILENQIKAAQGQRDKSVTILHNKLSS